MEFFVLDFKVIKYLFVVMVVVDFLEDFFGILVKF